MSIDWPQDIPSFIIGVIIPILVAWLKKRKVPVDRGPDNNTPPPARL